MVSFRRLSLFLELGHVSLFLCMPCYFLLLFKFGHLKKANSSSLYGLALYRERSSPISLGSSQASSVYVFVSSGLMCVTSQLKTFTCFYSGAPPADVRSTTLSGSSKQQGLPLFSAGPSVLLPFQSAPQETETSWAYPKKSEWWMHTSPFSHRKEKP